MQYEVALGVCAKAGVVWEVGVQHHLFDAVGGAAEQHIQTPADQTSDQTSDQTEKFWEPTRLL
jgi:hypothetical protein